MSIGIRILGALLHFSGRKNGYQNLSGLLLADRCQSEKLQPTQSLVNALSFAEFIPFLEQVCFGPTLQTSDRHLPAWAQGDHKFAACLIGLSDRRLGAKKQGRFALNTAPTDPSQLFLLRCHWREEKQPQLRNVAEI